MKFLYSRRTADKLTQEQAAEILGVSVRTVRRWEDRFEADGAEGLYDRQAGQQPCSNRYSYGDADLVRQPGITRQSISTRNLWNTMASPKATTGLTLQSHGRIQPAPRRGAHRRKRPRRPMVGMMLHQDGSSHEWVPDQWWDLIVTMDDANSRVYSAFFVSEEGTMSSFRALTEVINAHGLFCSLYADRGSHYWHTPEAGGKVDKENLTQVGRALQQLGIELIPAYSPQARGRSERMFGTFQNRLPQELRSHGITTMQEANRFLKEVYLPEHNGLFTKRSLVGPAGLEPATKAL